MSDALTLEHMSPELLKVVERALREPEGRFHSLAHLIDVPALERAFHRFRKDAAVGVDGVTKEAYGKELEYNLPDLNRRLKSKRYRHQALRRVHIPKGRGQRRPIGISADFGWGVNLPVQRVFNFRGGMFHARFCSTALPKHFLS